MDTLHTGYRAGHPPSPNAGRFSPTCQRTNRSSCPAPQTPACHSPATSASNTARLLGRMAMLWIVSLSLTCSDKGNSKAT